MTAFRKLAAQPQRLVAELAQEFVVDEEGHRSASMPLSEEMVAKKLRPISIGEHLHGYWIGHLAMPLLLLDNADSSSHFANPR